VTGAARRGIADAALAIGVFVAAFLYRFNTMGGALGGFTNDQFGSLSRARQIQSGAVPFRDFNDSGVLLFDYLSAATQWLGGYNLRSEALLTIGMLSLGAAVTFLLARRVAGSAVVAVLAVAVHIALDARHYNYPKIVLYAVGLALAWAYADRPSGARRIALGVLVGVGFLLRHDHLVYLGALSLMTVALVHRSSWRDGVRAAASVCGAAALFVVPFLLFLALSGGVAEYFRAAFVYITRDAQRTSFSLPRLSLDLSRPFVALSRTSASIETRINVRWNPVSDEDRRDREARWGLLLGEQLEGSTWTYELRDTSRANIEALIRDPLVEDTQGLDRTRFALSSESGPLRLESQLDTVENATAFLYYVIVLLPVAGAAALWRLRRAPGATRVLSSAAHLVPLLVLAAILNVSFLSRGSTSVRIADVGVTAAVLVAWLLSALAGRDGRVVVPHFWARVLVRAAAAAVLFLTVLSANGLAQASRTLRDAGFVDGPAEVTRRAGLVWTRLGEHPSTFAADEEQPGILRVARFINSCTSPEDQLFVLGEHSELYYFSDRRFAGGHVWLLPYYYSGDADEALIVARLKAARVPVVLTEAGSVYEEDYRHVFEQVHRYLEDEYTDAGEIDYGGSRPLRVLVRADLTPTRRYEPLGLPCFSHDAAI
jgi:hypothetical protein